MTNLSSNSLTTKILFLSVNPHNTHHLRLDEELKEIKNILARSPNRDYLSLESVGAVCYRDISSAILDKQPNIVHFSGHGAGEGGLCFEDELGEVIFIGAETLADLFRLLSGSVKCVVLNACYSQVQADAIALHIPYVIGMNQSIGDRAAIEFAIGFYQGVAGGKNYEVAYELGCNMISRSGILEDLTPKLYKRGIPQKQLAGGTINSFYIERPPVETKCYQAIQRQGMIIRIKAPQKMGKTMLMGKIFKFAEQNNYRTVLLNFRRPTNEVISSYEGFLQWFCSLVSQELELPSNNVAEYWKSAMGDNNTKCHEYLNKYILPEVDNTKALVLGLQSIDRIFLCEFANDFLSLLRSWFEDGQILENWKKLRLILAHSTDCYTAMPIEKSPFNVGEAIELYEFTSDQIRNFAERYGITLEQEQISQLKTQIGGHPYLVNQVIAFLYSDPDFQRATSLESLQMIFNDHLNELWNQINSNIAMKQTLRSLVEINQPIRVDDDKAFFILNSIGVVIKENEKVRLRNDLYRKFFKQKF